ncbi:MAG: ATP-binding protein [Pseudonocardiaceae bacterium]
MATLTAKVDLPTVVRSIPAARHVALELLSAWAVEHSRDDVALVVTELVTNVVDHVGGETSIVLELTLSDVWLTISVADGSAVQPVVRELCGDQQRGHGMRVVAAVADRWGCEDHHGGKRVWAELLVGPGI